MVQVTKGLSHLHLTCTKGGPQFKKERWYFLLYPPPLLESKDRFPDESALLFAWEL